MRQPEFPIRNRLESAVGGRLGALDDGSSPVSGNEVAQGPRRPSFDLVLTGFLILFLELASIRWFAASVVFLQFFTNTVLIGSFVGMACGCLAARRRRNWLNAFPALALTSVCAAVCTFAVYHVWHGLAIDVGGQGSPQEVFFGTEYRSRDVAQFVVPIEAVAGLFFVLVALMFVGLGQVLGRALDAHPDRLSAYALNTFGGIGGIVAFTALSFCCAPAFIWFVVVCFGAGCLLHRQGALTPAKTAALILVVLVVSGATDLLSRVRETRWSPYSLVNRNALTNEITVNTIGHQQAVPFAAGGSSYSLIHLLAQHAGGAPFRDVLIIGAGSGNDVAHALRFGAEHIDAVEIDPVINEFGLRYHPDRPYQDPRVTVHLDDGRHFLRTTARRYDLVVYALVDSLILHSGYANLRLESYLFTQPAFADVRRVLKPGGMFVMYNFFRQGWIVQRIAAMAASAFGRLPIVLGLPYLATLDASSKIGFMMVIAGENGRIDAAFARHGSFWLDVVPPRNLLVDGFTVNPAELAPEQARRYQRIAPTNVHAGNRDVLATSDDWPFLYVRARMVPNLTMRSTLLLGVLAVGMVCCFLPNRRIMPIPNPAEMLTRLRRSRASGNRSAAPRPACGQSTSPGRGISGRMLFLGAGFMLLETKAVVQMALLFGSTWLVNSLVFSTVLVLILLANLAVATAITVRLAWCYSGLVLLIALGILIPPNVFLAAGEIWRYALPCSVTLGPIFFAAVIFARSFRDEPSPDRAFGANVLGCVLGALSESLVTVLGFRYLTLLAMAFYLLSAVPARHRIGVRLAQTGV